MKTERILKNTEKITFLLNRIKMKIHESYLNLFVAEKNEYYSYHMPTEKQMKNKEFWIKIEKEDTK